MRVEWLRRATRDLEDQLEYIARENPDAADRAESRLREAVSHLGNFPEMGRVGRVHPTRELVVAGTRWVIVYRVGKAVEILRVLHAAQRWPTRV